MNGGNGRVSSMSDPEMIQELRKRLDLLDKSFRSMDEREVHLQKMMERIQVMLDNVNEMKVNKRDFMQLLGKLEGEEKGEKKMNEWWKWAIGLGLTLIGVAMALQTYFGAVGG